MRKIVITLNPDYYSRIQDQAQREEREVHQQATLILKRALDREAPEREVANAK